MILFFKSAISALSSPSPFAVSPFMSFNLLPIFLIFPMASSLTLTASSVASLAFLISSSSSSTLSSSFSFSLLTLVRALSLFSLLLLAAERALLAPAISSMRDDSCERMSWISSLRASLSFPMASCLLWRAAMSPAALASSDSMKACFSLTTACLKVAILVSFDLSCDWSSLIFFAALLSSITSRTLSSDSWSCAANVIMSAFCLSISSRAPPHLLSALSLAPSAVLSLSSSFWIASSFSAIKRAACSTCSTRPPLKSPLYPGPFEMLPSPPLSIILTAFLNFPIASSFSL
mmetsp:Transcript_23294/g.48441  ORF Transcript_23294/g.48441 Transcript_23294/m.48441 type:complete len:291 (-) Transcript_23294:5073-5945(-)